MIKYSYTFYLDAEERDDQRLKVRIRWNKIVLGYSLGYRVNRSRWNPDTNRCVRNSFHGDKKIPAYIINERIADMESTIVECFNSLKKAGETNPTKEKVSATIAQLQGKVTTQEESLEQTINAYIIDAARRGVKESSIKVFQSLKNCVLRHFPNKPLNQYKKNEFNECLSSLIRSKKNKTAKGYIIFLTSVIRRAAKKHPQVLDLLDDTPELPREQNVIYLTWDELLLMLNAELSKTLQVYRDVFCFCAFTGLRHSDVMNLKHSNIYNEAIHIIIQKTGKSVIIELNKYSKSILNKYSHLHQANDHVFKRCDNANMNRYLKKIAKQLNINTPTRYISCYGNRKIEEFKPKWELITTHCARKTFVVNCLSMGISPSIVIKWTGHSDYDAMKPYIDILDEEKKKAMNLFDNK